MLQLVFRFFPIVVAVSSLASCGVDPELERQEKSDLKWSIFSSDPLDGFIADAQSQIDWEVRAFWEWGWTRRPLTIEKDTASPPDRQGTLDFLGALLDDLPSKKSASQRQSSAKERNIVRLLDRLFKHSISLRMVLSDHFEARLTMDHVRTWLFWTDRIPTLVIKVDARSDNSGMPSSVELIDVLWRQVRFARNLVRPRGIEAKLKDDYRQMWEDRNKKNPRDVSKVVGYNDLFWEADDWLFDAIIEYSPRIEYAVHKMPQIRRVEFGNLEAFTKSAKRPTKIYDVSQIQAPEGSRRLNIFFPVLNNENGEQIGWFTKAAQQMVVNGDLSSGFEGAFRVGNELKKIMDLEDQRDIDRLRDRGI